MEGPIPPEVGQLGNLRYLRLGRNQLTGDIPDQLGQLTNLESLDLFNSQLNGPVPSELGQLGNLRYLNLGRNQLAGNIPDELGQLSNLETLDLSNNQLNGPIPPEVGQLGNLRYLRLGRNQLTGDIPDKLGQLSNLETLDLSNNQLNGSVPEEIGQLSNLETLNLSNNELSGPISSELGQLTNLRRLYLRENQLAGSIPVEIGQLQNLEELLFSNNYSIAGTLPWELRERIVSGELIFSAHGTQISGFAAPPKRTQNPLYADDPTSNGNASHSSIAYFQGPRTLERDLGGEPVEFQTPILGRWAMLSVSILHEVPEPPIVVTQVLDSNDHVLDDGLAEAAVPNTKSTGDGIWLTEYYFDLPGELFQAGNKFKHVIDPENELTETNEEDNVWEPFVVYGEEPPPFRVTFIPMQLATDEDEWYENVSFDPEVLMRGALAYLPIADDFEVGLGSAYRADEAEDSLGAIYELTELWNLRAGSDEFYHGLLSGRHGGRGWQPGNVAVSGFHIHSTIPHEFGHNLSLGHPPGCEAEYLDEDYPYPEGELGPTVAWDVNWRRYASASDDLFRDVMSYCGGIRSISDYNYRKAAEYWLSLGTGSSGVSTSPVFTEKHDSQTYATEEAGSLALSGRIGAGGVWSLTQAQLSQRDPRPPAADGEFTLILFDSAGVRIYAEPLSITNLSDSNGNASLWAARTPLPMRPAREILILDSQGNEVLRQLLPELE